MKLKKDIYSTFKKGHLYGAAGTAVTIIAHHGHVKIVEDVLGNRFSVSVENLINDEAIAEASNPNVVNNYSYKKVQKQQKKAVKQEPTLF